MPGVSVIDRDMDDGADAVTVITGNAEPFHQFIVSNGCRAAVHTGGEAVAADFFDICYTVSVNFLSVCLL